MRLALASLAAAALLSALFVSSCGSAACNANTCQGCCSAEGVCMRGVETTACGSAGTRCDVCAGAQTCQSGRCTTGSGGGAGGGGGGGGSGGGSGGNKRVFVTNATYTGDLATAGGKLSGLEGADALCNTAATAAALGGSWKAWASDGTVRAIDRITGSGPWHKLDSGKTLVFNNKANLATLPLVAIDYNENGVAVGGLEDIWTGTSTGGAGSGSSCLGWTTTGAVGTYGVTNTASWTDSATGGCANARRLYCFEL